MLSKFLCNEAASLIKCDKYDLLPFIHLGSFAGLKMIFFRLKRLLTRNMIDTLFILASAAGSVLLFYYYSPPSAKQFSMNLSWTLVSFAFIFPLTMTIRCSACPTPRAHAPPLTASNSECYKRRDQALQATQIKLC